MPDSRRGGGAVVPDKSLNSINFMLVLGVL